jgi:hypothetical protein
VPLCSTYFIEMESLPELALNRADRCKLLLPAFLRQVFLSSQGCPRTHYVARLVFKCTIHLFQPPNCRGCSYSPPPTSHDFLFPSFPFPFPFLFSFTLPSLPLLILTLWFYLDSASGSLNLTMSPTKSSSAPRHAFFLWVPEPYHLKYLSKAIFPSFDCTSNLFIFVFSPSSQCRVYYKDSESTTYVTTITV